MKAKQPGLHPTGADGGGNGRFGSLNGLESRVEDMDGDRSKAGPDVLDTDIEFNESLLFRGAVVAGCGATGFAVFRVANHDP